MKMKNARGMFIILVIILLLGLIVQTVRLTI
jgi:hypothetical protein